MAARRDRTAHFPIGSVFNIKLPLRENMPSFPTLANRNKCGTVYLFFRGDTRPTENRKIKRARRGAGIP